MVFTINTRQEIVHKEEMKSMTTTTTFSFSRRKLFWRGAMLRIFLFLYFPLFVLSYLFPFSSYLLTTHPSFYIYIISLLIHSHFLTTHL
jgi:hypothetical protein